MPYIRLSQFHDWVKKNQGDIVLVIGFILVAIIAFGAGRLTAPPVVKNPVVIERPDNSVINTAAISESLSAGQTSINAQTNLKGMFVGSKNSRFYHWPWCAPAKKIKPENEVWFQSEAQARAAGRSPSSCVAAEAPAGYKSQ